MKNINLIIALVFAFIGSVYTSFAQSSSPIIIEDYSIVYFTDELDADFYQAYVSYISDDNALAAIQITKAAAYIQIESSRAKEKDKKALNEAHLELLALATDLEQGKVESVKRLEEVFSKTHYALSRHHYANAVALEGKKDVEAAGHAMRNASKHLEHAARWSGHQAGKGAEATWNATKKTAHAIGKGTKVSAEEVSKGIKAVGSEIGKIGKSIFSRKKEVYDIYWIEDVDLY